MPRGTYILSDTKEIARKGRYLPEIWTFVPLPWLSRYLTGNSRWIPQSSEASLGDDAASRDNALQAKALWHVQRGMIAVNASKAPSRYHRPNETRLGGCGNRR